MRTVGKAVRYFNSEEYDKPDRRVFEGFDGGKNLGGRNVWVTSEVFRENVAYDIARYGTDPEDWHESRVYAINHSITTKHGILYPMVDCSLAYEHEHEHPEEVVDGCLACEDGSYVRELLARRREVDSRA